MKLHPKKQKFIGTPACSVRGKVLREKTNKPERLCRTLRTAGGHLISEIIFEPIPGWSLKPLEAVSYLTCLCLVEVFKEGEQPTCSKYDLRPKSVDNTS